MLSIAINFLVAFCVFLLFTFVFYAKLDDVGLSFLVITIQSISFVVYFSSRALNLKLIYYIFCLIFLCVIPWLNYSGGVLIWRTGEIPASVYLAVNFIIFISSFALYITSRLSKNTALPSRGGVAFFNLSVYEYFPIIAISLVGFVITLYLNNWEIGDLLVRGYADELADGRRIDESSLHLLISQVARFIPFFVFAFVATEVQGHRSLKAILFLIMLLNAFPTGVPRYMVGMIYIPIALLYVSVLRRDGRIFAIGLVSSVFLVFPFLDQFRNFSSFDELKIIPSGDYFSAAHFDAYENFASAFDYGFVTYGWQLVGVLLFFWPRSLWEGKPIGSGAEIAANFNYQWDNISMPYIAEGYVNFGLPGIVLFLIPLFWLIVKLDHLIQVRKLDRVRSRYRDVFYFYILGAFFFILRGDLLSSFAYTVSGVFVYFWVGTVMRRFFGAKVIL